MVPLSSSSCCSFVLLECHVIACKEQDSFHNNQPEKARPLQECRSKSFGPSRFANPLESFQLELQMFFKQDLHGCRKNSQKFGTKFAGGKSLTICLHVAPVVGEFCQLTHYQGAMLLYLLLCIFVHSLLEVFNFYDECCKDLLYYDAIASIDG
jgi:hypothetical protein